MPSATLLSLAQANVAPVLPTNSSQPPSSKLGDASQRFSDTLASALDGKPSEKVAAPPPIDAAQAAVNADANMRARQALQLGGVPAPASTPTQGSGDVVLSGLQKLRGAFDGELSKLSNVTTGNFTSSEGLFKVQAEFANFSMLMEVSSKLAGKGTQAFESLLKGQ